MTPTSQHSCTNRAGLDPPGPPPATTALWRHLPSTRRQRSSGDQAAAFGHEGRTTARRRRRAPAPPHRGHNRPRQRLSLDSQQLHAGSHRAVVPVRPPGPPARRHPPRGIGRLGGARCAPAATGSPTDPGSGERTAQKEQSTAAHRLGFVHGLPGAASMKAPGHGCQRMPPPASASGEKSDSLAWPSLMKPSW